MTKDPPLTLLDLNCHIQQTLDDAFARPYWVTGELSEARQASNGHFYGELIQKDDSGAGVLARARITCWARTFNLLHLRFMQESGQKLQAGIKVLLLVQVTFHPAYGLSLSMQDIDSGYTMGSMLLLRRQILRQLEADGILHDNKTLPLPRTTSRIAIVSAEGAAGYGDFCDQLLHNEYGLRFTVRLFPAVMQGQHVEESVIAALEQIAGQQTEWDAVVIIRGGGATADLACFDSYPLASCVAQFPLPVIVGIGHDRDTTVLDEVAHQRVKTPTAAAAFLIDHQLAELSALQSLCTTIRQLAGMQIQQGLHSLRQLTHALPLLFGKATMGHRHHTDHLAYRFSHASAGLLRAQSHRLDLLEQQTRYNDPQLQLNRGFSLTVANGHVVSDPSQLKSGDTIETRLARGSVHSTVTTIHPHPKDTKQ